jgi:mRNA interferase YafQ
MPRPIPTSRFRKDLKTRLGSDLESLIVVAEVMGRILRSERLGPEFKPHKLGGEYVDCWECHVLSDLLLIWLPDPKNDTVTFVRLGSHSELFG